MHRQKAQKMLLLIISMCSQLSYQQQNFEGTLAQLNQIQYDLLDIEEIMLIPQPEMKQSRNSNMHALYSAQEISQRDINCSVTQQECTCTKNWQVQEEPDIFFEGCANPNTDPMGPWCLVDIDTCDIDAGNLTIPFDYCKPSCPIGSGQGTLPNNTINMFNNTANMYELGILNDVYQDVGVGVGMELELEGEFQEFCNDTRAGCKCRFNWSFEGEIFNGCSNPDNDPIGIWCVVDLDSCDSTPKGANFGDTPYDYCLIDCPISRLSLAVLNPNQTIEENVILDIENFTVFEPTNELPLDEFTLEDIEDEEIIVDCKTSKAGCKCLEEWKFSQESYSGCANPDLDSSGAWCMIELGTCTNGDPFGANLNPPFDYCHSDCDNQYTQNEQQTTQIYSLLSSSDCEKTILGCTCQQSWEYKGEILSGCANPDNDPLGSWCAIEEGCAGQVTQLIINQVVTETFFDYCQPGCIEPQQEQLPQDSSDCHRTMNGCLCQPAWEFGGEIYSGCANPDDHDKGDWCEVLEETCRVDVSQLDPIFSQNMIVAYADNCNAQCIDNDYDNYIESVLELTSAQFYSEQLLQQQDNFTISDESDMAASPENETLEQGCSYETINGCTCRDLWKFEGQYYNACQNPDKDLMGNWCMIHEDGISCPSAKEMKDSDGRVIDYYDYCFEACPSLAESSNPNPTLTTFFSVELDAPPPPPPTPFTPCSTTQSGCKCRSEWMYDGNQDNINMAYFGCAQTLNDNISPWCQVEDINACEKLPRSIVLGDETGWDYCDPQCAPPSEGHCSMTLNGCECSSFWEYDGIVQSGCTRPDADKQFSWCVVDVRSCNLLGTSGQVPGTNEYWDICDSNC